MNDASLMRRSVAPLETSSVLHLVRGYAEIEIYADHSTPKRKEAPFSISLLLTSCNAFQSHREEPEAMISRSLRDAETSILSSIDSTSNGGGHSCGPIDGNFFCQNQCQLEFQVSITSDAIIEWTASDSANRSDDSISSKCCEKAMHQWLQSEMILER